MKHETSDTNRLRDRETNPADGLPSAQNGERTFSLGLRGAWSSAVPVRGFGNQICSSELWQTHRVHPEAQNQNAPSRLLPLTADLAEMLKEVRLWLTPDRLALDLVTRIDEALERASRALVAK